MRRKKTESFLLFLLTLCSCDFIYKDNGQFGRSITKEEAARNGSPVSVYVPNRFSFSLLDGTTLLIDTAWTEVSFSYHNGKRILNSKYGYHFCIPFKKKILESFTFIFSLVDKSNQSFTNGIEDKLCQLNPTELHDGMKVILEQKDPDTSKGWTHPIITDTIVFRKLK